MVIFEVHSIVYLDIILDCTNFQLVRINIISIFSIEVFEKNRFEDINECEIDIWLFSIYLLR